MQMRVLHGLQPNISICICHQFSIEWNYKFWIVRYCVRYSHKLVGHEDYDYIYRVTEYMRFGSGSVHGPHGSFQIKKNSKTNMGGLEASRVCSCAAVQWQGQNNKHETIIHSAISVCGRTQDKVCRPSRALSVSYVWHTLASFKLLSVFRLKLVAAGNVHAFGLLV